MKKRNIATFILVSFLICGSLVFGQRDLKKPDKGGKVTAKPSPTVTTTATPRVVSSTPVPPIPGNTGLNTPVNSKTKKRLAIIAFENRARKWWSGEWDVGASLASILAYQLANEGVYDLVNYTQETSLKELQDKSKGGRFSRDTAIEIGRLKSANVAAVGEVIDFDTITNESKDFLGRITSKKTGIVTIIVTLYDIQTGELVGSAKAKGASPPQISRSGVGAIIWGIGNDGKIIENISSSNWQQTFLNDAADAAIKIIVQRLLSFNQTGEFGDKGLGPIVRRTEAKVADFDKKTKKVVLNISASEGVKIGDIFKIMRQGKCMKDPDTGEILKCDETEVAQIKITFVNDKYSEGEVISGGNIKNKDTAIKKTE